MVFTQVITVLSAQKYDFKDDDGKRMDGCKVTYIEDWSSLTKENSKGVEILTSTMPFAEYDKLINLPAQYNAEFGMRKGPKGVPMLVIANMNFVEKFDPFKSNEVDKK